MTFKSHPYLHGSALVWIRIEIKKTVSASELKLMRTHNTALTVPVPWGSSFETVYIHDNPLMLALCSGVRKFGKNFKTIAEVLGTKTEAQFI